VPPFSHLIRTLLKHYRRAERVAGRVERYYVVAGHPIRLRFAGPSAAPYVTAALEHLRVSATDSAELTVCIWESQSTGVGIPPLNAPSGMYNLRASRSFFSLCGQSQIEGFLSRFSLAVMGFAGVDDYPPYLQAAPLRSILIRHLYQYQRYGLHAAAVGTPEGAALIVGPSGSGKSTTALTCLSQGFAFLGDDFCVLELEPSPRVHCLYRTARLRSDSREWLSQYNSAAFGADPHGKTLYLLSAEPGKPAVTNLPIRAILIPQVTPGQPTKVRPATAGEALYALGPSTIQHLALPNEFAQPTINSLACLVRRVPCYHLSLGQDLRQLPQVVLSALRDGC
jgi:hypothetical protein